MTQPPDTQPFEDSLRALFAEVDAPASVANWRDRISDAEPVSEPVGAVVHQLPFEPQARRPATSWQRVAAAAVVVLALGFAIIGVVTSDRVLAPPPKPDVTQSMTDQPPTNSSSAPPTSNSAVQLGPPGQALTTGQGSPASGGPPQGGVLTPDPGNTPVEPARGPLADWPDSANAGVPAGTTLGSQSGDLHITTPGAVIHDVRIDGVVYVEAPDVTLRRVLVAPPSGAPAGVWQLAGATGLHVEDSEIAGVASGAQYGIRQDAAGLTVQRSDIYGVDTAITVASGATIVDSYLRGFGAGVLTGGNTAGLTVRHNTSTGTLSITDENGPVTGVIIDGNQLGIGIGVAIYAPSGSGSHDIQVLNNQLHKGGTGDVTPVSGWNAQAPGNAWTGNVWFGTTDPVNP